VVHDAQQQQQEQQQEQDFEDGFWVDAAADTVDTSDAFPVRVMLRPAPSCGLCGAEMRLPHKP
jgi:hypothetical protein